MKTKQSWYDRVVEKYNSLSKGQKRMFNSALAFAAVKIMNAMRNRKGKKE